MSTVEIVPYRDSRLKSNSVKNLFSKISTPKFDIDIEKNKLKRIKSGRINIDGTIDLHGLSLKEAEKRLELFVGESFQLNKRLLLIITGKGRNSKPNIFGKTLNKKVRLTNGFQKSFITIR